MINISMVVTQEVYGKGSQPYDFLQDLSGEKTRAEFLQFMKDTLAIIADTELREAQSKGFDKNPVMAVDGVIGKSIKDIKPFGSVVFQSRQEAEFVFGPIYDALLSRSKVDTGLYKDSHVVMFNNVVIAANKAEFNTWLAKKVPLKNGDYLRFVNIMPYAGKVERQGITAKKSPNIRLKKSTDRYQRSGSHVRTPNGAYFLTAKAVVRQFKFNSNIRFEWVNGSNIKSATALAPSTNRRGGKLRKDFASRKKGRKGRYAYPSIVVRINERGLIQS